MIRRVVGIYFSPIGGTAGMTKRLVGEIAERLSDGSPVEIATEEYELLRMGPETVDLDDETVAVVGMPVYVGKVPLPAVNALRRFRAGGAQCVAAVSFGARTYGNALYELNHYAEEQGFKVIGAGAFSVRYRKNGLRQEYGEGCGDAEAIDRFGSAAAAKIRRLAGSEIEGLRIKPAPLEVAGRLPVHLTSRISPAAAAAAQDILERICVRRRDSEWYL